MCAAVALGCTLPATADAASTFTVRGAGYGHGVGMSQYGAYGFALEGRNHRQILAHYYTDTELGTMPRSTVRVLLQSGVSTARFSGARRGAGRRLSPAKTYAARRGAGGTVELLSPTGRVLERVAAPLRVAGGRLVLRGGALNGISDGTYRDALEFRPGSSGLLSVNALDLEDFVRGVVARESPSSWPLEALKAQAVAARTYAVTTSKGGTGWDHYPDTRSQVYGGVAAETPSTDQAVRETAGQVVTYDGAPVVTYFFSTSGGRTEDVEKSALGTTPLPWLRSVPDPYDTASPRHRWGPIRWSTGAAGGKLSGLVKGSFRGIRVVERGTSPRIVWADVVGTAGRTRVSGATLRARLGLYDSWARFTSIRTGKAPKGWPVGTPPTPEARAARAFDALTGSVLPARRGAAVALQRRRGGAWRTVGHAETGPGGAYAFTVTAPGRYRVAYRGDRGPAVTLR
jgi:stage II sporulation protein D